MQKKSKKIIASVVAVLMVLSVGYFALLAPTSAWFNQENEDSHTFTFGAFDVDETASESISEEVPLRAATRFADAGEDLFDEVVHVVEVDVTNYGELDANVQVAVKDTDTDTMLDVSTSDLKWFVTDTLPEEGATGEYTTAVKGVYKTAIEDMLTASEVTLQKYGDLPVATAESDYETYNATAMDALSAHNAAGIGVDASDSTTVYVVFWAEYGNLKTDLNGSSDFTQDFNIEVEFTATPNLENYEVTSTTSAVTAS